MTSSFKFISSISQHLFDGKGVRLFTLKLDKEKDSNTITLKLANPRRR
jgi:hypothetical protein